MKAHQHYDRDQGGKHETSHVERSHRGAAEKAVEPSADEPSRSGKSNAHLGVIPPQGDDFAGNEAGDYSQYDPTNHAYQHVAPSLKSDALLFNCETKKANTIESRNWDSFASAYSKTGLPAFGRDTLYLVIRGLKYSVGS
jgi:hypothetical protein